MKAILRLICMIITLCFGVNSFGIIHTYAYQHDLADRSGVQRPSFRTVKALPKTAANSDKALIIDPIFKQENEESLWYSKKLPMKKEHQKVLWDFCKARKLDYIDMLALIYTESNFDEKCSSGSFKGYFQIGRAHFASLSKTLKTPNKPLDGIVNINWGTAMFSWIMADKRVSKHSGKKKLDVALSIYQRGTGGYDRGGLNYRFTRIFYKKREIVRSYFKNN